MNANAVAKHYGSLTPEERFRLIVAASARGDHAEQDRLVNAGRRITLSMPDHSPYAHAFEELALLTFMELLEEAARYLEAFYRAENAFDIFGGDDAEEQEGGEENEDDEAEEPLTPEPSEKDAGQRPAWQRSLELAYAAGFVLRTKADGWKLFCERMNVPPFLLWEGLPGFDRLRRALALAEKAAFASEGMLRWLNDIRPAGEPEQTELSLDVAGVAAEAEGIFRGRVGWWGG
jgi:hypothetical protein